MENRRSTVPSKTWTTFARTCTGRIALVENCGIDLAIPILHIQPLHQRNRNLESRRKLKQNAPPLFPAHVVDNPHAQRRASIPSGPHQIPSHDPAAASPIPSQTRPWCLLSAAPIRPSPTLKSRGLSQGVPRIASARSCPPPDSESCAAARVGPLVLALAPFADAIPDALS